MWEAPCARRSVPQRLAARPEAGAQPNTECLSPAPSQLSGARDWDADSVAVSKAGSAAGCSRPRRLLVQLGLLTAQGPGEDEASCFSSLGSPQLALTCASFMTCLGRHRGGLQGGSAGLSDSGALETLCLHWADVPAASLVINACSTYFKEPDLILHDPGRGKFGGLNFLKVANPRAHLLAIHPPPPGTRHPPPSQPTRPAKPRCVQAPASRPRDHRGKGSTHTLGVGAPGSGGLCSWGVTRHGETRGIGGPGNCSQRTGIQAPRHGRAAGCRGWEGTPQGASHFKG